MGYISREAFAECQRHLYCDNCARRKGMKRGKMQFVYEIGDAPCRACDIHDLLCAVEDFPAADVRENKSGKWTQRTDHWTGGYVCSECGHMVFCGTTNYCPNCGANMVEASDEKG